MKLLMFQANQCTFRPFEKMLPDADESREVQASEGVVVFLHSEPQDEAALADLETKVVTNIKWITGKCGLRTVVLHSFTHLAEASASPALARTFIDSAAARLRNTGYEVAVTPFGWVGAWDLSVYGESLAKVFKSL